MAIWKVCCVKDQFGTERRRVDNSAIIWLPSTHRRWRVPKARAWVVARTVYEQSLFMFAGFGGDVTP